jgi:high-affinity nickel-transport protein
LSLPGDVADPSTTPRQTEHPRVLKVYQTADQGPARKINYNIVITSVSILSALAVGAIAAATLLTEGGRLAPRIC